MAKKYTYMDEDEYKGWNVSRDFCEVKIMRWLEQLDVLEIQSERGVAHLEDEFMLTQEMKNRYKLVALERFLQTLRLIIGNSIFAMKKDSHKTVLKNFLKDLKTLKKVLPTVSQIKYSEKSRNKILSIKTEEFNYILNILINIKDELNEYLKEAKLIFPEEYKPFDIKNFRSELAEKIRTVG